MSRPEWAEKESSVIFVGAVMVSVCVEELFARLGSVWSAVTVAIFETTPGAPGIVRIVTVTVAALAMVPTWQVTVPPASEHVPWVLVDDR